MLTRSLGSVPQTQTLPGLLPREIKLLVGLEGWSSVGGDCPSLAVYLGRFQLQALSWALLSLGSSRESFSNGSEKGISALVMLVPCPVSPGAGGRLLWMLPAGERCQEEGWLVHGKIGLDLGAPAGLEAPPGADVMTTPVLEGECGSGGKPGGLLGSSNQAFRAAL